jgi:hypothetical protein
MKDIISHLESRSAFELFACQYAFECVAVMPSESHILRCRKLCRGGRAHRPSAAARACGAAPARIFAPSRPSSPHST